MAKKYRYEVQRQVKGGVRVMLKTKDYKKAAKFYHEHPRAYGIQRYNKHGWTAGLLQPRIPNKITFRGKTYTRTYVGPHKKSFAQKVVKNFRKGGMPAQARKMKKGWFIYAKR